MAWYTKYPFRISLPFKKCIGSILKEETGVELLDGKFGNVWCGLSDTDAALVRTWMQDQGGTVFLRDLLDLSIALSNHFGDGGRVLEFYEVEARAKYQQDRQAISTVVQKVCETIARLPFYRDADVISCVPPRPSKGFDLPTVIAQEVAKTLGKDVLVAGEWVGEKGQLKEAQVSEKWERLEGAGFNPSPEARGKRVVLIDDLYQSGCTMHFIASKLKDAGATRVYGLSLIKSGRNTDNQL